MARFSNRDRRTGRYSVNTENTPVDATFQTYTSIDVEVPGGSPADLAYISVGRDENITGRPEYAAPSVTDEPAFEPLHPRSRVDDYGLRDPFCRLDQHLVERAQAGTNRLRGDGRQ